MSSKHLLFTVIVLFVSLLGYGQEKITGTITDEKGETLIGVTIAIEGTQSGTITDTYGHFSIDIQGDQMLHISYVGYQTERIRVGKSTHLNIELKPDVTALEEVVVTGFQTIDKTRVTGSFATVSGEDLDKVVTPNLSDKLAGQMPGLEIRDGKMVIRGQNTFNTGEIEGIPINASAQNADGIRLADGTEISYRSDPSKPLIVLDGFPYSGELDDLDPNDIESITLLKDASASSVWGTRAANGVLVITRKKTGSSVVDAVYSNQFRLTERPDFDDYNYARSQVVFDLEETVILDPVYGFSPNTFGPQSILQHLLVDDTGLSYVELQAALSQIRSYSNYEDAARLFYRDAFNQTHSLQIRHAGSRVTNILSANYGHGLESFQRNNNNNFRVSLRTQIDVADWIKLNLNYTNRLHNRDLNSSANLFSSGSIRPYERFYDQDGNYSTMYNTRGKSYYVQDYYPGMGYLPWHWNAAEEQNLSNRTSKTRSDIIQVATDMQLPFKFKFSTMLQYQYSRTNRDLFYNEQSFFTRNLVNTYTQLEEISPGIYNRIYNVPLGGGFEQSVLNESASLNFRNQLNYNNLINETHGISLIAGSNYTREDNDFVTRTIIGYNPASGQHGTSYVNLNNLITDPIVVMNYTYNGSQTLIRNFANSDGFNKYRDLGLYSVFTYNYKLRYDFVASARIDKSNLFSEAGSNKLWSLGAGWVISQEPFMYRLKESGIIGFLKIRASYGYTGNVDRSAVPYLIGYEDYNVYAGTRVIEIRGPSNPDLKMEKTRNTNIGADVHLFSNRIRLNLDYYNNYSTNLIVEQKTDPTINGWSTGKINNGSISNNGVELKLDAAAIRKQFQWNISLNASYNRNMVVDYGSENVASYFKELIEGRAKMPGHAVNPIFSYQYAGLSEEGTSTIIIDGERRSIDLRDENGASVRGYQLLSKEDLIYAGSRVPIVFGGLYNAFSYKGITLGLNFMFEGGHYFRLPNVDIHAGNLLRKLPHKDIEHAWKSPGDELYTDIPRITPSRHNQNDPIWKNSIILENNTSWFHYAHSRVEKADNIRLKYVNLSYVIPRKLLTKLGIGIKYIRLDAQISNVWHWSLNSQGIDPRYINLPNPREYTIGINVKF